MKKKIYISFDINNDDDVFERFIKEIYDNKYPYHISGTSLGTAFYKLDDIREEITKCDLVIVLCGYHTNDASNVSLETKIADEEIIPHIYLNGRNNKFLVTMPSKAKDSDVIYQWSLKNINLINEKLDLN
ncbi:MAG: hypothetical protein KAU02_04995 [Tenericutes bacterium]|nr:hypothetical protein [Mycoplasmatota bacterium]